MIIEDNIKCYSCGNCKIKCPHGAISIEYNNEGFYKPIINPEKCTHCGLCSKFCVIDSEYLYLNNSNKIYIGYSKNETLISKSSSGGIFKELANYIVKNNGFVSGALFKDGILQHVVSNDETLIDKMSGSKYLQSKIGSVFEDIEKLLRKNILVLFSGTPCQVASLKHFLKKDYRTLITLDILCHSIPSSELFYNYAYEVLEEQVKITDCTFRDKSVSWHSPKLKINSANSEYIALLKNDKYCNAFFSSLISNTPCSECKFASLNRVGDITLGDAWCAQYLFKDFENPKGTSLFFINNKKGNQIFNKVKNKVKLKKIKKKEAICGNPILEKPFLKHVKREDFFKAVHNRKNKKISTIIDEYLDITKNVAILNFYFENSNYGAVLTAFALNKLLNNSDYNAYNINFAPDWFDRNNINENFESFKSKYIPSTPICDDIDSLRELNKQFNTFIVGSDQVFRPKFASDKHGIYYLNFVNNKKNKISCAASFGVNYYEGSEIEKQKLKYYLSKFDFLSVREDSGINIIKNITNRQVFHLLDPVFLLDKNEYLNLFNNKFSDNTGIISYILNDNVRNYIDSLDKNIKNIREGLSIEDWLETLFKAELIITDSFHAICFSLIFNKPFVVIVNKDCPLERILSLFRMFNIDHNKILFFNKSLSYNIILSNIINPTQIQIKIEKLREEHRNILIDKIANKQTKNKPIIHINKTKIKKLKKRYKLLKIFSLGNKRKTFSNKIKHINMLNNIIEYENWNN